MALTRKAGVRRHASGRRGRVKADPARPPYRVPPLAEILAVPDAGLRVASTFSGCGGTCLGFRWAGYRTLWANEFVPAARDTYRANFPDVRLDERDVRAVTARGILRACGLRRGELDVLEGSPPCAAFSTAGRREKGWARERKYSDTTQRVDDLFFEFARLLEGLRPRAFVAENVSGLVKGVAKGYFKEILAALGAGGYLVVARVIDAQWLGVPQARQRVFFVGVRDDLAAAGLRPTFPTPLPYRYSVRDALRELFADVEVRIVHDTSGNRSAGDVTDRPLPAVLVGLHGLDARHHQVRRVVHDTRGHPQYSGGDVTDRPSPTVLESPALFLEQEAARHAVDGTAVGAELDRLRPGEQSSRYFNLVRPDERAACPTVTAAGGQRGLASVAHPVERRKFTIAELRRVCGFPDDFVLTGTYAQQWERLGRSVCPPVARAVAERLRDDVLLPAREAGL